jgi:hypothetical protein
MKLLSTLILSAVILSTATGFKTTGIDPKEIVGAWEYGGPENRTVMIATDKVFSVANYDIPGRKFIKSYGGRWRIDNNKLIKTIEWNSADSSQVGKELSEDIQISGGKLISKSTSETWTRADDGSPGKLQGAWIITGNFRNDSAIKRSNPFFPRRTMKILSGKYFHWIAYNVTTKSFMNAGGGSYTTTDGKYTETIEFFTKTAESVGKKLVFDYSIVNGDWRHRGEKSTGGPMDECWSRRDVYEK